MPRGPDGADVAGRLRCVHYLGRVQLHEGGVARALLDICSALASRGHAVTPLPAEPTDVPAAWDGERAELPRAITIPAPRPLRALPPQAEAAIRGAHVLHLHTPWGFANLSLAHRAGQLGVPYVVSIHG